MNLKEVNDRLETYIGEKADAFSAWGERIFSEYTTLIMVGSVVMLLVFLCVIVPLAFLGRL